VFRTLPCLPKGTKNHHCTTRVMVEASSHVPLYSLVESTQRVYDLRLFFVSARTNKAHHHNHVNQDLGDDKKVERDETDPYNEVIFGRRRPDSMTVDWNNKVLSVLEFKRTSDQRHTYREHRESRARAQHKVLVKSLEKVAGEAEGENRGWK
jgi:hypothetical protein